MRCEAENCLCSSTTIPPQPKSEMAFSVTRWYHSAKRDLSVGRSDARGNFKTVPFEIILCILDYLPPASILSLALTCRYFHYRLCDQISSLQNRKVREEFLQMLERELAGRYFCYHCQKLHKRDRIWSRRYMHHGISHGIYKSPCLGTFLTKTPFTMSSTVGFNYARLVMNRHLFGPSHGYPLWILDSPEKDREFDGITVSWTRKARILDDELYFCSECTIKSDKRFIEPLREFLNMKSSIRLCHHVLVTKEFIDEFELAHTVLQMLRVPIVADRIHTVALSCPQCLTDFSIGIWWTKKYGWTVSVAVYQCLGPCRSPYEWKWRAMGEDVRYNKPRSFLHAAGVVRQRWLREEKKFEHWVRDEFLGTPTNVDVYIRGERRCPWYSIDHWAHDCATYGEEERI